MSCSCRPNVHTQRELESLTRRKLRDPKFTWNDRFCNHIGRHLGVLKRDPYGKIQFCVLRVQVCQEEVAGGPPSLEAFRYQRSSRAARENRKQMREPDHDFFLLRNYNVVDLDVQSDSVPDVPNQKAYLLQFKDDERPELKLSLGESSPPKLHRLPRVPDQDQARERDRPRLSRHPVGSQTERGSDAGSVWIVDGKGFRRLVDMEIQKAQRLRYCVSLLCIAADRRSPDGAGSRNSDRSLSGNSGRSKQALRSRSTRAKRPPNASPGRGRSDRSHDPA